ncbi:TfoX/Sxy family protein [Aestuariicoccus sp. MJ-SS9]|uniref:TfoX/Sxy family protein n=1 Tax=Aestuariicoccus sp. MJ-SS9 TaxID=3079855 RepID=UPI00290B41CE|nr:TfoX/Sxy family protein [Aestuariicoccus sp. MJ-SS9]MDU8913127.1 TfoX/Sxy family protein [Aestuariicoccus sp. MJ-SS9]
MPADPGLVDLMRDDIGARPGLREKRMFGGLCFMLDGHMFCGVHKDGAMYRVGKPREAQAMALPGARPMAFTGRPMKGFVEVASEDMGDDAARAEWLRLALENVASLPPKSA